MKNDTHLQSVEQQMNFKGMAFSTKKAYLSCLNIFFQGFPDKDAKRLTIDDARSFVSNLIKNKISRSYQKQISCAIRFFFEQCLGRKKMLLMLPNPNKMTYIPNTITPEEFGRIAMSCSNIKHKAILCLQYSCGLRVSEVCNLKMVDINSQEKSITIREPKWNIERKVMLDESVLDLLRRYYTTYKPKTYLFEGDSDSAYSIRSVQSILKAACIRAEITKNITTHSLRHSCFTQLIKNGVDISNIKYLAGHKNISTTEKYIHIAAKDVINIKSPISGIPIG